MNKVLFWGSMPEARCFKYLGIIINSNLQWTDHVNYTLRKAWKALHFIMHILEKEIVIGNILLIQH